MRARPRILFETEFECVSRMQTAEPVYVARPIHLSMGSQIARITGKGERRTVGCATATQNRIATSALDSRDYRARGCVALDEDELILEVGLNLSDSCACVSFSLITPREYTPCNLVREPEMSFTQPSQVIGTAKVVYCGVSGGVFSHTDRRRTWKGSIMMDEARNRRAEYRQNNRIIKSRITKEPKEPKGKELKISPIPTAE